jgi:hypothetical protein
LDSDALIIDFYNAPQPSYGAELISPDEIPDFCFDLTRFTKVTRIACYPIIQITNNNINGSIHSLDECFVPLNLKFAPDVPLVFYGDRTLTIIDYNALGLYLDTIPDYQLTLLNHIKSTIENIPQSVVEMRINVLFWQTLESFPFKNVTSIIVANGMEYDHAEFTKRGIKVNICVDICDKTCIGLISSRAVYRWMRCLNQRHTLKLEAECATLRTEMDELKAQMARLLAATATAPAPQTPSADA